VSAPPVRHVFVYGTLKRGQCRERCWPHRPLQVHEATILAALYDLGPYPAIALGEDQVRGEVWEIAAEHVDETISVLDRVEGHEQLGNDLYVRRVAVCHLEDGREIEAWTYYYGDVSRLIESQRIRPTATGWAVWPVA
jgi:gamma-glutamylcyclotransferase (GGCT)/AIG2-like uncharacterized protein YtfP